MLRKQAGLRRKAVLKWEGRAKGSLGRPTQRKVFERDQNAVARQTIFMLLSDFLPSCSWGKKLP